MFTKENVQKSQENFTEFCENAVNLMADARIVQQTKQPDIKVDREQMIEECKEELNQSVILHLEELNKRTYEFFLKLQEDDRDLYQRLDRCLPIDFKSNAHTALNLDINVNIPEKIMHEIYSLGLFHFDKKEYEPALNYFIGLSFLDPNQAIFTFIKGLTEKKLHKDQEAVGSFVTAIQQDPTYLPAYLFLVKSLIDLHQIHTAHQVLTPILHRLKDFSEVTKDSLSLIEELKKQLKI